MVIFGGVSIGDTGGNYSKPTSKCDHFEVGLPAGNQIFLFLFSIFKVDSLYHP